MLTSRIIKMIVENVSGIDDISIKKRDRFHADVRFCYFKLCNVYKKIINESTTMIGKTVNRDHATMLHGIKKFDDLFKTESFMGNDIYISCLVEISKIDGDARGLDELIKEYDIKMYFKIKHLKLIEKTHSVISNMQRKIDILTKNDLVKKILTLEAEEIEELEDRLNVFFKVKAKLKEKV